MSVPGHGLGHPPATRYIRRYPRAAPTGVDTKLDRILSEHIKTLPPLPRIPAPPNAASNVVGKTPIRKEDSKTSSSSFVVRIATRKPWTKSDLNDLDPDLAALKKEVLTSSVPKPTRFRASSSSGSNVGRVFEVHFDRPWKAVHFWRWGLLGGNGGDPDFLRNFTWIAEREEAVVLVDKEEVMMEKEIEKEPEERLWSKVVGDGDDDGKDVDDDSCRDDESYFNAYSKMSIHRYMLMDRVRTGAYEEAILENLHLFRGKVVMDVGCGTGILSMLAAKAGAAHVIAVEKSSIALTARMVVADNGFSDVITVHHSLVEELDLPEYEGRVDVIVSEWMGYCLLFESMLGSVLHARDRFLRPDVGLLFPDSAKILVHGVSDAYLYRSRLDWLKPSWEFDLEHFRSLVCREISVQEIPRRHIVTGGQVVHSFSLKDYQLPTSSSSGPPLCHAAMSLKVNRDFAGPVHGLSISFSVSFFHGKRLITLSNSPLETPTHWKQSFLLFKKPIEVTPFAEIVGFLQIRQPRETRHRLDLRVQLGAAAAKSSFEEEEEPKVQKVWQR